MGDIYLDVHTHKWKENGILNVFAGDETGEGFFTIGIHPWYVSESWRGLLLDILEKSERKNCLAIGEVGLDKVCKTEWELQKEVFFEQVKISEEVKKPMIIHCVRAYGEILEVRKRAKAKQVWILHGYNKNIEIAQGMIKKGMMISVGAEVLVSERLQMVVREVEMRDFLIETDDSQQDIRLIYNKISEVKGVRVEDVCNRMKENFERVFLQGNMFVLLS